MTFVIYTFYTIVFSHNIRMLYHIRETFCGMCAGVYVTTNYSDVLTIVYRVKGLLTLTCVVEKQKKAKCECVYIDCPRNTYTNF